MLVHSTDITIHAKSMQFHEKYTPKYSIWAPLEPSRGDQNESPSHLGACRVPLPPKWVTRRCHYLRFPTVLCSFLGALLSQSASKDGPRFDKIGKVVHPSWSADKFWKMLGMSRNSGTSEHKKYGFCSRVEAICTFLQISRSVAKYLHKLTAFGGPGLCFCDFGPG